MARAEGDWVVTLALARPQSQSTCSKILRGPNYFCGHLHYYNRMQPGDDGAWQVIVGTAGAPQYVPAPSVTGTTIPSQYGFATVDVDGPTVKVTFYGDTDGDGHYNDVMDSFFIVVPKGGEERVPSGGPVSQPAATVEERECLMPGFWGLPMVERESIGPVHSLIEARFNCSTESWRRLYGAKTLTSSGSLRTRYGRSQW